MLLESICCSMLLYDWSTVLFNTFFIFASHLFIHSMLVCTIFAFYKCITIITYFNVKYLKLCAIEICNCSGKVVFFSLSFFAFLCLTHTDTHPICLKEKKYSMHAMFGNNLPLICFKSKRNTSLSSKQRKKADLKCAWDMNSWHLFSFF